MIFYLLQKINVFFFRLKFISFSFLNTFVFKTNFFFFFLKKNELIWQEGLLIDFLQKKSFDNFLKKFLIYSSYLYNEKFIFDKLVKFFINLIINPFQKFFFFEVLNISNFFFINLLFYFLIFFSMIFFFVIFFFF